MQTFSLISLLLLSIPAFANPIPDGTPPAPTPTPTLTRLCGPCPYSSTVTKRAVCTAPVCTNPMMCPAIIRIQEYPCCCLKYKDTTTTVTARCPSDCNCTIPTEYVPTGCPSTSTTTKTTTSRPVLTHITLPTRSLTRIVPTVTRFTIGPVDPTLVAERDEEA